jgi:chromate transporter
MVKNVKTLLEILFVSTYLGLTSFGGPIAHLGYFHNEYVRKRKWLDEKAYSELVALAQFLPGPASSQVGIGIGVMRAGLLGGIVSFIGFTLPSVIALIFFALAIHTFDIEKSGWINGLKIVAVAIVAQAILGMANKLTPDLKRRIIALLSLVILLIWQTTFTQVGVIVISGLIGFFLFKNISEVVNSSDFNFPITRSFGAGCLILFFSLLILLPILRENTTLNWIPIFDSFYRSGSLVFGGGHVVLPLLEREFVPLGLLSKEDFIAGYGMTQAVPGPLFTFAAYIGAVIGGWKGGLLATFAIFLPAFLLILGALPFWNSLRKNPKVNSAFMGVNACVVGILISAFFDPIWTSTVKSPTDFAFTAVLFSMLTFGKLPPWLVVISGAIGGFLFL